MSSGTALFPNGVIGAGLLLLRFAVSVSLLMLAAHLAPGSWVPQGIFAVIAAGVCSGLQTRVLAGISVLAPLFGLVMGAAPAGVIVLHVMATTALSLTGPGAFSADARLFGRRTITLPNGDHSNE
jgi:hypothetical protein